MIIATPHKNARLFGTVRSCLFGFDRTWSHSDIQLLGCTLLLRTFFSTRPNSLTRYTETVQPLYDRIHPLPPSIPSFFMIVLTAIHSPPRTSLIYPFINFRFHTIHPFYPFASNYFYTPPATKSCLVLYAVLRRSVPDGSTTGLCTPSSLLLVVLFFWLALQMSWHIDFSVVFRLWVVQIPVGPVESDSTRVWL